MNWQHRYGAPARPRAHDHTIWASDDPPQWPLRIAIAGALICIILGVTIWAPVGGTF